MRYVTIIFGFVLIWCWLAGGCSKPATGDKTEQPVVGQSKETFPSFAAGTWQQRDGTWKIVIEPNGVVSSVVIPLMETEVKPHHTTEVEMRDGSTSTFTGGDFVAECNPITRELSVIAETKEFNIRFLDNRLDGNRLDSFSGPVSEDGEVWEPNWIEVFDYGPNFPQDENDIYPEPVVFDKVEL